MLVETIMMNTRKVKSYIIGIHKLRYIFLFFFLRTLQFSERDTHTLRLGTRPPPVEESKKKSCCKRN